jgi:tetratricopeptide (TPR) repeat protein
MSPLQQALDLLPLDIQCIKSLALAAFAMGQKDASLQSYQKALSLSPLDTEVLFGLGILYVSSGNLKCAYKQYELLLANKSHLAEDLYARILERKDLLAA